MNSGGRVYNEPFFCPDCQYSFAWDGECPHCEEPLIDTREVPEWQRESKRNPIEELHAWAVVGAALLAFAVAYFAMLPWLVPQLQEPSLLSLVGRSLWLLALLASLPVSRALTPLLRKRNARRRRDALSITSIASATDGPVRIEGAAKATRLAYNPGHAPSLAYEQSRRERGRVGTWVVHRANGGELEIHDGSGSVAVVRAEHLHITEGVERDGQLVIPVGARIEVIGEGRWETSSTESGVAHSRRAARVLRVEGTAERPLLLRIVHERADAKASSGVRVEPRSVEGEAHDVDAHDRRATTASARARD